MPKKYRLVRTDPGVLDLSQVLDEQGKPVLLKKAGDFAVVDQATAQHPLVKRFVGAGLKLEEVSLTPVQAPATPVVDNVPAPPKPAPEPPKPTPPPEPPSTPPDVMTKEDVPKDEPEAKAEDAPRETSSGSSWAKPKTTKKTTTKKSTKRGK